MGRWALAAAMVVVSGGCTRPQPGIVEIDRSRAVALPEHPSYTDLFPGRYHELMYLAHTGDRGAVAAILRIATSDEMTSSALRVDDLLAAACANGNEGAFWASLPELSPERQCRAILRYEWLAALAARPEGPRWAGPDKTHAVAPYPIVDFDSDRDAFLTAHPDVRSLYEAALAADADAG